MDRPAAGEAAEYYQKYIKLVPKEPLLDVLYKQNQQFGAFFAQINNDQASFRYDKGKWSIREVIGHLVDVELVFCYRALGTSRGDKTDFPGFEEDDYVKNSRYDQMELGQLIELFYNCRRATIALFSSFDDKMMKKKGKANKNPFTVRAIGYIIAGHLIHHMKVISERYLKAMNQK